MMKNLLILALLLVVGWMSVRLVDLEKYHYASMVGFCADWRDAHFYSYDPTTREACLHETETRTSWAWHLLYALKIL